MRTLVAVQPLPGSLAEGPGSPRARRPAAPARVPPHASRPSSSRLDSDGFAASSCLRPCRPISLPLILARQTRQELLRARAAAHARRLPEMPPWPAPSLRARGSRSLEDPARCQPPDGHVGCSWQTWKCCLTAQGTRIMTLGGVLKWPMDSRHGSGLWNGPRFPAERPASACTECEPVSESRAPGQSAPASVRVGRTVKPSHSL